MSRIKNDNSFSIEVGIRDIIPGEVYSYPASKNVLEDVKSKFSVLKEPSNEYDTFITLPLSEFDRFFKEYAGKENFFKWDEILTEPNNLWTHQRLIELKDYIKLADRRAWRYLIEREDVIWTEELINELSDQIDFNALSKNESIDWTEHLIDKWLEEWDWVRLSGNNGLPWSLEFLTKYKQKWKWIPDYIESAYQRGRYDNNLRFGFPSISTNSGITWDLTTFETFIDKLDYWLLATTANILDEVFIHYHYLFEVKQYCGWKQYRSSDNRKSEKIMKTAFEQYRVNDNFHITNDLLQFSKNKKVKVRRNSVGYNDNLDTIDVSLFEIWTKDLF